MGVQPDVSFARTVGKTWWVIALVGLLSIVAGVVVLAQPSISLATLAVIAGIFLLIDGIFEVTWSLFRSMENRGMIAILGVLSAVIGVILIRHPIHGVVAIALLLGLWLLVAGIVRLIQTLGEREGRFWSAVLAALEIIAGIVIVASPGIGVATLALLIGISWIVRGVAAVMVGWTVRELGHAAKDLAEPTPAPV